MAEPGVIALIVAVVVAALAAFALGWRMRQTNKTKELPTQQPVEPRALMKAPTESVAEDNREATDDDSSDTDMGEEVILERDPTAESEEDDPENPSVDVHKCKSAACEVCKQAMERQVSFLPVRGASVLNDKFKSFMREVSVMPVESDDLVAEEEDTIEGPSSISSRVSSWDSYHRRDPNDDDNFSQIRDL